MDMDIAIPGKPVVCNSGLLWLIYGLLWGIVACCFRLPAFQVVLVSQVPEAS